MFLFFFKQKTAYEVRISDWSSDVCSSDLLENHLFHEIGLVVAIGFALVTLVAGVLSHGYMMPFAVGSFGLGMMAGALSRPHDGSEVVATMIGVAIVALGHDLNPRAGHCNAMHAACGPPSKALHGPTRQDRSGGKCGIVR